LKKGKVYENKDIKMLNLQQEIERLKELFGDFQPREIILLNVIENLHKQVEEQKIAIQKLKDEINRLKGEQGKPEFKSKVEKKDISSETERRGTTSKSDKKKKKRKKRDLPVHETKKQQ
jgi:hypothetical protein